MTLYSRKEAAAILGVSMTTLDKMREDRKIGYLQARPGGKCNSRSHISINTFSESSKNRVRNMRANQRK